MNWTEILNWANKSLNQGQNYLGMMSGQNTTSPFEGLTKGTNAAKAFKTTKSMWDNPGGAIGGAEKSPFKSSNTVKSPFGAFAKAGGIGGIGNIAGAFDSLIPNTADNPITEGLNKGYDFTANALMKVPGWGSIAGGAMKVAGFASDGLNKITNGATTVNNALMTGDKVLSSKFLALTPFGLGNALTKKSVDGSDQDLEGSVTRGYQATTGVGDAEFGGISRGLKKLFTGKDDAKYRQSRVNNINTENALKFQIGNNAQKNETASNNTFGDVYNRNRQSLKGGQRTNILSAKKGAKLSTIKSIKEKSKHNVIPSGALHARKNNLPEEIAKEVTHKGIPVISMDEKGGIMQHAEIENSEIIFNKEVTTKLEGLLKSYENGNEDAAIEAGKLLAFEVLENTEDNVGILNT